MPISASISIPISISYLSIYISLSLTSTQKWNHSQHPLCLTGHPFQTKSLLLDSSTAILSSLVARSFPKWFNILIIWPYMIPPKHPKPHKKRTPKNGGVFFCVRKIYKAGCSLSSALRMQIFTRRRNFSLHSLKHKNTLRFQLFRLFRIGGFLSHGK